MTREQHEAARRAWWTRQFERGHSLSVAARIKEADEALAGYDKAFPAPVEREPDEATAAQLDEALALIADLVTGARTIDQAREWLDDHHFSSPVAARVDPKPEPFQKQVLAWLHVCFGEDIAADTLERADRFVEEALELAQTDPQFTADRAHALVDYVFGRPAGMPSQEAGGVMLTLAALCEARGIDLDAAAKAELARVWTKVEAIRAKQAAKPVGSALPVATPTERDWIDHTPGDPMPCERTAFVDVQFDDGTVIRDHQAVCFYWEGSATGNIIAWRPAQ